LSKKPALMKAEIARIIKERSNGIVSGVAAGNATVRFVKATYYHAAEFMDETLPIKEPCRQVVIRKTKRKDGRKEQKILPALEIPEWNRQRLALADEVRREYHLMALLSGLRRNDLETMEWANVQPLARKVFIPAPKGGEEEEGGFDLVLTLPMVECLNRAKRAGEKLYPILAARWVFPSDTRASGHVEQATKDAISYSNHALRRSYSSIAAGAGVPPAIYDMLLDHRPKSVSGIHYVKREGMGRYYEEAQGKISRAIVKALA
jgi:integrase